MNDRVLPGAEDDVLTCPAPRLGVDEARRLLAAAWGIQAVSVSDLVSERDLNLSVDGQFVLKVSNPAERSDLVDMETMALAHARAVAPDLPLPETVSTVTGTESASVRDESGRACLARLITVVPGAPAEGQPVATDLAEEIGALCARTSLALQGMFHPAASRVLDWDVRRADTVLDGADPAALGVSETGLAGLRNRFRAAAQSSLALPSGVNHADVTLTNILLTDGRVSGLIDFGDMHHTANVCDLAVTLTSVLRNTAPQQDATMWDLTRAVITGYQRHRPLSPEEVDVLGDFVLARLAVTVAISVRRSDQHKDNARYINQYDGPNLRVLRELSSIAAGDLTDRLHRIAGTARAPRTTGRLVSQPDEADLLGRRHRAMGGQLSPLFYARPLEIVGGEGPWLIAANGTRYLDAYNNVAVVGHAHPAVVQAVTRQLAAVNTHSRYLHTGVVELAERLLATMPDELDTCLFTTSGTEANELAWRMATAHTGGTGAIIAEHAYHGSSAWLADLSSNEWPGGRQPARVATFAAPRAATGGLDGVTAAQRISAAADRLRAAADDPALVLADLGFTSEGILDAPTDFLRGLIDGAHGTGALFLADEVQIGFGRIGPRLWRFAAHDLVPDFVTLGKPMGAGYPIGAVVTRREIADRLARDYEYFSTFAATPAAAAASLAVLDVLDESDLPSRAVLVGDYLRERLRDLAGRHARLGAVRGSGLIAGVDTLAATGEPDGAFSRELLDELARHRVLAGRTGPGSTVLKVRPPLVWGRDHVDLFVHALDASLGVLGDG